MDSFFSIVVPVVEMHNGVYFRDEGDCVVSLFTDYFNSSASYDEVHKFCKFVSSKTYGKGALSAKSTVACGDVGIFQKAHEVGSDDWSAEGAPFVRAARLEQVIESKKMFVYYKDDYEAHFRRFSRFTSHEVLTKPYWQHDEVSKQIGRAHV